MRVSVKETGEEKAIWIIGLEKRYGLLTVIAMVVGIVIGVVYFLKQENVLTATGRQSFLRNFGVALGGLDDDLCSV